MIKALVGLGNEGGEYASTYHNVGNFVAKEIATLAEEGGRTLRVYPLEGFMNESGPHVFAWMKMNGLKLDEVVIIHDEGDLLVGNFKLSSESGSAGHNGIKSLIETFKTESFLRLRVGVRDENEQIRRKTGEFVLNNWNKEQEASFVEVAKKAWVALCDK